MIQQNFTTTVSERDKLYTCNKDFKSFWCLFLCLSESDNKEPILFCNLALSGEINNNGELFCGFVLSLLGWRMNRLSCFWYLCVSLLPDCYRLVTSLWYLCNLLCLIKQQLEMESWFWLKAFLLFLTLTNRSSVSNT